MSQSPATIDSTINWAYLAYFLYAGLAAGAVVGVAWIGVQLWWESK